MWGFAPRRYAPTVDSRRSSAPVLLAPGASASFAPARAPGRGESLPAVDDRLIAPEANAQVFDGVVIETMGANPPHATRHLEVAHVFRGCLAGGYEAAVDMLTRIDRKNDLAPDVSVFPAERAAGGGRKLEEIVFEVFDGEDEAHVTEKARKFAARGVRRVLHVRVDTRTVAEWSPAKDDWETLGEGAEIRDRCFVVPLPVRALVDRVLADDTVAKALVARRHPVIEAVRSEGRAEGRAEGLRAVNQFVLRLGRPLDDAELERLLARLDALGPARLEAETGALRGGDLAAWLAGSVS